MEFSGSLTIYSSWSNECRLGCYNRSKEAGHAGIHFIQFDVAFLCQSIL